LAVAALVAGSVAADAAYRPTPPSLQLTPCVIGGVAARCGSLAVPEDRGTRTGRLISVRIAVVPAQGHEARPDPVFWFSGGPGVAATDDLPGAVRFLQQVNWDRDVVFVDQRGTGGSNSLDCPKGTDPAQWADEVRACLAGLAGDAAAYTTAWAMDDVDDVRTALGYRTVNLYGGSYGATAVQVYLQRYPEHVRTATLLSGSLLEVPLFERFPVNSQRALDAVFARCAADPACRAAFPDPASDLRSLATQLDAAPADLPLTDPATGKPGQFHRENLGPGVHGQLMNVESASSLPFLLHAASHGNWIPVTATATAGSGPAMWSAMGLTIICHEPWARLRASSTQDAGSYLSYADVRAMVFPEEVCAAVPAPRPEALYGDPVVVPAPMLWLNGSADPQDPPDNVAAAPRTYPGSLTLTMPGQSHQYSGAGCLNDVIGAFIDSASTLDLPTDCLAQLPIPPFTLP
jgi:pimeloyl-ACP methyl ester carboxylesterase